MRSLMLRASILLIAQIFHGQSWASGLEIKNFTREMLQNPYEDAFDLFGANNIFAYKNDFESGQGLRNYTIYLEHITPDGIVHQKQCDGQFHTGKWATRFMTSYFGVQAVSGSLVLASHMSPIENEFPQTGGYKVNRLINMQTCEYRDTRYPVKFSFKMPTDSDVVYDSKLDAPQYRNKTVQDFFSDANGKGYTPSVLANDGSYKIFVHDLENCTGARCAYIVDTDGTMKNKNIAYLPKEYALSEMRFFQATAEDDYFVTAYDFPHQKTCIAENFTFLFAQPGSTKEILRFKWADAVYSFNSMKRFASVCRVTDFNKKTNSSTIECRRYDSMNYDIFDAAPLEFPFAVKILKIKQLYEGGLIILAEECKSDVLGKDCSFHLTLMSPEGKYTKIAEVPGFEYDSEKFTDVDTYISYEDDNICISAIQMPEYKVLKPSLKVDRRCFVEKIPGAFQYL